MTPELSIIVGCIFLGAAVYFIYALLRPSWANAAGQLSGFLVYDLVLIIPFLRTSEPTVAPEFRTGLIVYTFVVVYSGLLAIYYLFINKHTHGQRPEDNLHCRTICKSFSERYQITLTDCQASFFDF